MEQLTEGFRQGHRTFGRTRVNRGSHFQDSVCCNPKLCIFVEQHHLLGLLTTRFSPSPAGCPSAPQNLQVSKVTESTVTLRWDRPSSDGGARIKGYVVEKRDPHRHTYTQVGTCISTDFTVRGSALCCF